jgi:hypothetical protein
MNLRTGDLGYQRQAALIDKNVVFAAELATISWVPTGVLTATR